MKKIYFFYIYLFLIFFTILLQNSLKPFPFFTVNYINDLKEYNSEPKKNFYALSDNQYIIPNNIKGKINNLKLEKNLFKKIRFATEITRSIQEKSLGKKIRNIDKILNNDTSFKEICSESSKIFVYLMLSMNETARVIWTNGHTVSEVWDGKNWIMVDTLSNFMNYDFKSERYLSFAETIMDTKNLNLRSITNKRYNLYDYFNSNAAEQTKIINIYNSSEFIFFMSNTYLYNFHNNKQKLSRIYGSIFDNNPEVMGYQFLINNKVKIKIGNFFNNLFN